MTITIEVNIPDKIEAEKMWSSGDYAGAAKKYLSAATFAAQALKDEPLSKKLIVQHYLAEVSSPGKLNSDKIYMLVNSIDDFILNSLDDRLEYKFKPYKAYFSIILDYLNENKGNLEKHRLILNDKRNNNNLTEYESLSLIMTEMALSKQSFKEGKGNLNSLNKLSVNLTELIEESKLPNDIKRKIKEFSIKIAQDVDLEAKKKVIDEAFSELKKISSNIIIPSFQKILSDLITDIEHEQLKRYNKKKNPFLKILNYSLFFLNAGLLIVYLYYRLNKGLDAFISIIIAIVTAIWATRSLSKYFETNRMLLLVQIAIVIILAILIYKVYNSTHLAIQ